MDETSKFEELLSIDVSDKLEKKKAGGVELSYLSWAYAWAQFKKTCPDAMYEIKKFDDGKGCKLPYMYDEKTGYMVNTEVFANGMAHEMWLPVLDGNNKAMKKDPYDYTTSKGVKKHVEAATMFDVNTAIMRCLVKNMAMFGLGLNVYAGEDLPQDMTIPTAEEKQEKADSLVEQIKNATTISEIDLIYQTNKKAIVANKLLLELISERGRKLKGAA